MSSAEPRSFEEYLGWLARERDSHSCESPDYVARKAAAKARMLETFGETSSQQAQHALLGQLRMPYFRMGAIDSVNLFDIDELIIFAFYCSTRGLYPKAIDIGANIGLHSIVMAKLGMVVRCYEPDPIHLQRLQANVALNGVQDNVEAVMAAVSDYSGHAEFVRVLGNTTGSHLAGAKTGSYGGLERFDVRVEPIALAIEGVDFMKLDAEGEEARILLSTTAAQWERMDAIVEVGSPRNAELIHGHFDRIGINLFAQKRNWERV
ncbi:MAG: FkbM family methyltransferase, partial [Gammaproteobacteria bacterium]